MKVIVEMDLERFEESLEEKVMHKISERITQRFFNDAYINACEKLGDKVDALIDKALMEFMDRRIVVTDSWGDKVEEYENVHELLKDRFDKFMTEQVDRDGKVVKKSCSYRSEDTRIMHIINNVAKLHINKFTRHVSQTVQNQLSKLLTESLKEDLSGTVFKNLDVKKLLRGY